MLLIYWASCMWVQVTPIGLVWAGKERLAIPCPLLWVFPCPLISNASVDQTYTHRSMSLCPFFQPHWLLCQSKGISRKRGSSSALQPINYINVLADTISVPIQRLHPLKAAFQDRMHPCGTTKAVPFQDSKCALRFPQRIQQMDPS